MNRAMKTTLIGAALTVAPVLPAMLGSSAEAHGRAGVTVSVTVPAAPLVFGFSFGNPGLYGHVHHGPAVCAAGPLYYYPNHRVYAHHHPRLRYHDYARPVLYPVHYRAAYPLHDPRWKRHHANKHKHGRHRHRDDDDDN